MNSLLEKTILNVYIPHAFTIVSSVCIDRKRQTLFPPRTVISAETQTAELTFQRKIEARYYSRAFYIFVFGLLHTVELTNLLSRGRATRERSIELSPRA